MMNKYAIIILSIVTLACNDDTGTSDAYGNFESDEIIVSSEGNGRIQVLNIEEGDRVKRGAILGFVDTTQLSLQKQKLNYQIQALKAKTRDIPTQVLVYEEQRRVLVREIERVKALLKDGAATQKQLDDLEGELDVVGRRMKAMESQLTTGNRGLLSEIRPLQIQLELLADQIDKSIITAPIAGTILVLYKKPGEVALLDNRFSSWQILSPSSCESISVENNLSR